MVQELLQNTAYESVFAGGVQIVENRQIVEVNCAKGRQWKVESQTQKGCWYHTRATNGSWSCTCRAHMVGHKICSHIMASFILGAALGRESPAGEEVPDLPEIWCRFCGSEDCSHTEYGTLKRMISGEGDSETSKYRCNECERKFVNRPGFEGLHYSERVVLSAIRRVAEGCSPAGAARTLKDENIVSVSDRTVRRWVKKFSDLVSAFTNMLKLPRGIGVMSIDEKHFKTGGKDRFIFETISAQSRYIISYDTAYDKLNYDATELVQKAVKIAGMPLILVSDRLRGFRTAHKNVTEAGLRPQTMHIANAAINKVHANNNRHERRNGETATRMNNARGFNSKTPSLLILGIIHHNFLRPHLGLNGKTPAEVEGIRIPGRDKLHTLIRCAAFSRIRFA